MFSSRRATIFILTGSFLLLLAAGLLNYLVNPYRLYAPELVPPLAIQPRTDKYRLMVANPDAAEILLLGSSRMRLMRPELVTALTGLRAFNATISRAMPRDYLIFGRFAVDELHPQQIVAGMDLQVFHPTVEWDTGGWIENSPLRPYADGDVPSQTLEQQLGSLFSLQQTLHSIEAVAKMIQTPQEVFPYNPDGSIKASVLPADDTIQRGTGAVEDVEFWSSYTELDPDDLEEARAFFALCQQHDITLTVVMLPFDSRALASLRETPNFNARLDDYRNFLAESAQEYEFTVYDFTDPSSYGGDPEGFADYYHPLQGTTDSVTRAIFSAG